MTAAIELVGVSKHFGAVHALEAIDLTVEPGEIVTLLGPSGSGKTTLLRLVGGLAEPTAGRVTVAGGSPHDARAGKRIGFVPQSPALLPWRTVAANARLLLDVNRRRTVHGPSPTELLGEVGLLDFADAYPHQLSGGMQQRVALVRAMALGAPLLLMDEPFAALDEITRADMRHLLARLCEQLATTVLFVTHSIAESVFISDRVGVLSARPGRLVGIETIDLAHPRHPELEDDPAFFAIETRLRALLHAGYRDDEHATHPARRAHRHRRVRARVGGLRPPLRRAPDHPAAAVAHRRGARRAARLLPRGRGRHGAPRPRRHRDLARRRRRHRLGARRVARSSSRRPSPCSSSCSWRRGSPTSRRS